GRLGGGVVVGGGDGRVVGAGVRAGPRVAALNLHGSLLPAYRGRAPLNWVLVNGETRTGVTLHHMTPVADAGDVVAQRSIEIEPDDTAFTLYERMVKVGVELLLESYPGVLAGTAPRIPQDDACATTVPRRRPQDGRVAWARRAAATATVGRGGAEPSPGAFVGDGPARLTLWAASLAEASPGRAAPGTLVAIVPARGLVVATGRGAVLLARVQEAGGSAGRADRWAGRAGPPPGMRL